MSIRHIHTPVDPRIFVFGSNLQGIHGAGAARYARLKLGAVMGVGEGLMGVWETDMCYALPTCSHPGVPLSLSLVKHYVERFLQYAREESGLRFFVSAVGCGLAGFKESDIAPMFAHAPSNCDLPPGWPQESEPSHV